ncbi:hypothetical protein F5H01DRAFT_328785 [Linnemannia elongata]|nr:hypothetical protein F5H01DRAFT_328785 [Linnemannia elongata]
MPLSNHAHDTLNESSLPGRDSQGHRRSLNNQASPDHQQPSAHERNSPSDRSRNTHNRTRFINPFKQFFRKDDPPPTSSDASSIETNYRLLPLLIGCILPVSILINVPSITSPWVGRPSYNETLQDWNDPEVLEIPHWLNGIIISALAMSIICNICVLFRFLERHVYRSVVLSLVTATIQDILCVCAVVPFGILYPPSKGYVYLEGFWTMLASILFSFLATILISIDLHRTPNFRLQGSGVTHKQRILIAEAMSLCFYLAIGALIFIYLEKWTFLDALFFVMVTITTIGFGDRVPQTTGGRIFVVVYAAGGIVLLALAINAIRYVILEDLHRRFAIRSKERKAKRDARRRERRDQRVREEEQRLRLQETMERIQLIEASQPPVDSGTSTTPGAPEAKTSPNGTVSDAHYLTHFPRHFDAANGSRLRLPSIFTRSMSGSEPRSVDSANSRQQGASNITLGDNPSQGAIEMLRTQGSNVSQYEQVGANANEVSSGSQAGATSRRDPYKVDDDLLRYATVYPRYSHSPTRERWLGRFRFFRRPSTQEAIQPTTLEEQREADKRQAYQESMMEYQRRLRLSAAMFLTFWLVGAIIFTFVESWDFGASVYFVFIAFSSIGYGDYVPRTMAGRSVFLAYCLVGVVTLTSLASLISEVLSKTMRKHVVETQLRRTEQLEALDYGRGGRRDDDADLEHGVSRTDVDDTGSFRVGASDTDNPNGTAAQATETVDKSCHGTLQNLVEVSKSFDEMLRKIVGLEYTENERRAIASNSPSQPSPHQPENPNPGAIVTYLEAEDDESEPSFLSPSISRDITSASSIHRHTLRPMMHERRHSHEPQFGGTFHGSGSASQRDSNHINITAWPTAVPPSHVTHLRREHGRSRSQSSTPPPAPGFLQVPTSAKASVSAPKYIRDSMVTIPAVQWQSMIEYSKRFKALTLACEEALQKVAEWEASEKRLRQRRCDARLRQKRHIEERRKLLQQLRESHGAADDDTDKEEELEELDEWDEEGSDDEEDDEDLENQRARIASSLLGPPAISRARSSPGRLRLLTHSRSISPDSRQPRTPPAPLLQTPHAHAHSRQRRHSRLREHRRDQAHRHQQEHNPELGGAQQAIDNRNHVLLDVPYRSESPEPLETPVASSSNEGGSGTVGSPSSVQPGRPLLSPRRYVSKVDMTRG